ncbi:hypothetical protein [Clostridium vincentii]|uniref:Uncharacterized protein n=1 Tax=Clostridium vincentii TaxID=52704 RepID=A0A2T0B7I1_9CLOT|nr:hypothetical protein [Clostridium vincentii]PRR79849.1 hypothetical protein CLVI_31770 [Clostridium vincentii]
MKKMKRIVLSIFYFIGIVILALVTTGVVFVAYYYSKLFLFAKGDYLLFVSGELDMIPITMILALITYAFIRIKEKFSERKNKQIEIIEEDTETVDIETLSKPEKFFYKLLNKLIPFDDKITKIFKVIKICCICVLIISIYCGMTGYAILYPNSIKVSTPTTPKGTIYNYSDINSVNVGVAKGHKNSYSPYYKVIFNDDKSVNFFSDGMQASKNMNFEDVLINLDNELRAQGVIKSVNKENFEGYAKDLDKGFVSRVEKLFDDK